MKCCSDNVRLSRITKVGVDEFSPDTSGTAQAASRPVESSKSSGWYKAKLLLHTIYRSSITDFRL